MNRPRSIENRAVEIYTTLDIDKNGFISMEEMEKSKDYLTRNSLNQTLKTLKNNNKTISSFVCGFISTLCYCLPSL